MVNRRSFIKTGCAACLGVAGLAVFLESCSGVLPMIKLDNTNEKILKVPLASFTSQKSTMFIVRSTALENDILLEKNGESYKALYLKCTHEGYSLTPIATKIYCNAHGSEFNLNGEVVKEPALKPLKQFKTEINDNNIIIHLI